MRNTIIAATLAVLIGGGLVAQHLAVSSPRANGCGVELWSKKTGSDAGARSVDLTHSTWASVHSMQQFAAPNPLTSTRVPPVETTNYRLTVTLVRFKLEADSDIHLILQGAAGRQMIAEIPSPTCLSSPDPFVSRIAATRAAFEAHYRASGTWQEVDIPIRLSGVGFFDFPHGQSGHASNYIELHPVLSLQFLAPTSRYRPRALPGTDNGTD